MPHTNNKEVEKRFKEQFCKRRLTPLKDEIPMLSSVTQAQAIIDFLHQELQKARQDWLREEIVKLGGVKTELESKLSTHTTFELEDKVEIIQTIIDRYHSELDQPTN